MIFDESQTAKLKRWIKNELRATATCKTDETILSDYILSLLGREMNMRELKIFMIDELEDNLCIRCFIKKMNKDKKNKEKKILDDWIESVLI